MTEVLEPTPNEAQRESWYGMTAGTLLADRYRIERLISRGGMGAVFEATQLGLDRAVAVKMLLPTLSRDEKVQERFRREARSAAGLHHPHIIQIYDYGISEHGPYIVMELVRGQSFRQALRQGPFNVELAVELMEQVCSALATAHAAGIIHRDLKPDNQLMEQLTEGQFAAKVLDFGIAKMREVQVEENDTNLTGTNIIGSPAYMSPEQSLGMELDARADVYSLGIVLYEMLTGTTPFGKATPGALLMHHVHTPPRSVRDFRGEIPEAIEAVVNIALAKDRAYRFATATQFAQSLREALDNPNTYDTQLYRPPSGELGNPFGLRDGFATSTLPPTSIPSNSTSVTTAQRRRLAILPLRNLAGDAEIEYLGFALADSVITQLAPLKSLIVRPSSAVEKYRNQIADPRAVGRELQVDTILSGSYLKAGEMFRVNVQLIDVLHNEILWQERIDQKFDNVITLQDKLCEELIRGLQLKVTTHEQEAIKRDEASNPIAYELYLRGLAWGSTAEEQKLAIDVLQASVNLDPTYAPAWAALAGRYLNSRSYLHDESMFAKAEIAARKALEINPQLPSALFWLAVYLGEKGDIPQALATCKQLLQAAPNSEYAYQAMGHAYEYAGLTDVALTLFRKATEINPMAYPYMIGLVLYQQGNYEEARHELIRHMDDFNEAPYWLSLIDISQGDLAAASNRLNDLAQKEDRIWMLALINALRASLDGDFERGQEILDGALAGGTQFAGHHYIMSAQIYAQLKAPEKGLALLQRAVKSGYANLPFVSSDRLLAPVRALPGFAELSKSMQKMQTQMQLMLVTG